MNELNGAPPANERGEGLAPAGRGKQVEGSLVATLSWGVVCDSDQKKSEVPQIFK